MKEQITIFYIKDKKHTNNYIVKRVLTPQSGNYTITSYYMINGKLKVFPSKLKLSGEKLNCYLLQCMKSNFFDRIEGQFIMEGEFKCLN